MNINTRLQWRYKPASDFFLVYTDNYYTNSVFGADQGRGAETELLVKYVTSLRPKVQSLKPLHE